MDVDAEESDVLANSDDHMEQEPPNVDGKPSPLNADAATGVVLCLYSCLFCR
jgi:hypothetical protein